MSRCRYWLGLFVVNDIQLRLPEPVDDRGIDHGHGIKSIAVKQITLLVPEGAAGSSLEKSVFNPIKSGRGGTSLSFLSYSGAEVNVLDFVCSSWAGDHQWDDGTGC